MGWLALGALFVALAQAPVHGAGACAHHGRSVCVPEGGGVLLKVEGDVRRSRGIGFNAVAAGADLVAGDRLIVRQGSAVVGLSSQCQVPVSANSLVSFSNGDKGFCAHGLFASDRAPAGASAAPR